jgi:hypothetical protein
MLSPSFAWICGTAGGALAAAVAAACVPVTPAGPGAGKEAPAWAEAMREVHGRFTGKPGTLALFGDSIFVSLAFWAPLAGDPKDLTPAMAEALRRGSRNSSPRSP